HTPSQPSQPAINPAIMAEHNRRIKAMEHFSQTCQDLYSWTREARYLVEELMEAYTLTDGTKGNSLKGFHPELARTLNAKRRKSLDVFWDITKENIRREAEYAEFREGELYHLDNELGLELRAAFAFVYSPPKRLIKWLSANS
ncbi:hypothetical protein, partial [Streptomyces sp. NPDC001774]